MLQLFYDRSYDVQGIQTELPSMIGDKMLCVTKIIDQLNYSESHTGNLLYCDSIMKGYQYSNEHV